MKYEIWQGYWDDFKKVAVVVEKNDKVLFFGLNDKAEELYGKIGYGEKSYTPNDGQEYINALIDMFRFSSTVAIKKIQEIIILKHLPGKHDQKEHGRRGGGNINSSSVYFLDNNKMIHSEMKAACNQMNFWMKDRGRDNVFYECGVGLDKEGRIIKAKNLSEVDKLWREQIDKVSDNVLCGTDGGLDIQGFIQKDMHTLIHTHREQSVGLSIYDIASLYNHENFKEIMEIRPSGKFSYCIKGDKKISGKTLIGQWKRIEENEGKVKSFKEYNDRVKMICKSYGIKIIEGELK